MGIEADSKTQRDVRGFLEWIVGDGSKIHPQHDDWHPQGELSYNCDDQAIFAVGNHPSAKISSAFIDGQWHWRLPRTLDQRLMHQGCQLEQI